MRERGGRGGGYERGRRRYVGNAFDVFGFVVAIVRISSVVTGDFIVGVIVVWISDILTTAIPMLLF